MSHRFVPVVQQRRLFVQAVLARTQSFTGVCRLFSYSRRTGYKWLHRFEQEGWGGLSDRSSRPESAAPHGARQRWQAAVVALRRKWSWGPKKIYHELRRTHPRARLPSPRTIARLLEEEGWIGTHEVRSRPGPEVPPPVRREVQGCHDLWTIDFKGYFLTGDGSRCEPLTLRDLHSRFLLLIEHAPKQTERAVRTAMTRCFRQHGLPAALRVDNGAPFGGRGPRGLSQLSVWWWRLGIAVEFTRPAHPQDNGAHEQMHRVLKQATASPPAATLRAQAARFTKFRRHYNEERPHEALGMETPARRYVPSTRAYRPPRPLSYAPGWATRRVMVGGRIWWQGRVRVIGRAFQRELLGLKATAGADPETAQVVEVYLGTLLLGEMHARDPGGLRAVRWRPPTKRSTPKKEG